jgi:hypothetical protein
MSKPLDELREALRRVMDEWILSGGISTGEMYDAINSFEEAHPGLVDYTVPCHRCGSPCSGAERESVYQNGAPGKPNFIAMAVCPACAKEATDG